MKGGINRCAILSCTSAIKLRGFLAFAEARRLPFSLRILFRRSLKGKKIVKKNPCHVKGRYDMLENVSSDWRNRNWSATGKWVSTEFFIIYALTIYIQNRFAWIAVWIKLEISTEHHCPECPTDTHTNSCVSLQLPLILVLLLCKSLCPFS